MPRQIKTLNDMMGGAVTERFNAALKTVLANVFDPNTDATKKRKITIELTVSPSKDRSTAEFGLNLKTLLASPTAVNQTMMLNRDDSGNITATEIGAQLPGQLDMDEVETPPPGVISFKSAK